MLTIGVIEQFDWTSPDECTRISFRVTAMLGDIAKGKLTVARVTTLIDTDFVDTWVAKRDLNMTHVAMMSNARLNVPVLGAVMPDEDVLLIDGSHRMMARRMRGETTIEYNLVAPQDWLPYATITGKWPL